MATSPLPPTTVAVLDSTGQFTLPWRRWFQALQTAVGGVGPEGPPGTDGKDGKDGASDDVAAALAFAQLDAGVQLSAGPGVILRPPLLTQGAGIISAQMFGTGLDGLDGEDGQTVPGTAGARGAAGASGFPIPGIDGDPGDDGWTIPGLRGVSGASGLTIPGLDGDPGEDGQPIPGPRGLQGLPGPAAFLGLDGADGDDSYMIDVGAQTIARTPFVPTVSFATLGDLSVAYTTQLGLRRGRPAGRVLVQPRLYPDIHYSRRKLPDFATACGSFRWPGMGVADSAACLTGVASGQDGHYSSTAGVGGYYPVWTGDDRRRGQLSDHADHEWGAGQPKLQRLLLLMDRRD